MRAYLDTNILVFLFTEQKDEIDAGIREQLLDYSNILLTSSVCVQELIHLCQTGKLKSGRGKRDLLPTEVIQWLDDTGIELMPVTKKHLQEYSALPFHGDHRDPSDRLIIAQAISDRVPLISSDRKFHQYLRDGLEFVYNER